jgi:predicted SAM-dependent methyltransferase
MTMKKLLKYCLNYLGFALVKKSTLLKFSSGQILAKNQINSFDLANARGNLNLGLEERLKKENKLKWLEVGTGGRRDNGFDCIDIIDFSEDEKPNNYHKLNIVTCSDDELMELGKYDFVRMQHVFEHFTPEDGLLVLNKLAGILNDDGYILVSCPDIDIVIDSYLSGSVASLNGQWGLERFDRSAPDSFIFSIFTHSVLSEPHLWCYNAAGLMYQFERSGKYKNVEILDLANSKSSIPFTHNRPQQDVVLLAQRR